MQALESGLTLQPRVATPVSAAHITAPAYTYRPDIDGLRAIAVLVVILNHFNRDILPGGYLGVDMFFVISGYVITASLSNRRCGTFAEFITRFYAARVRRLLPALCVCVAVTCIVGALFINPQAGEFRASMKAATRALFGLSNIYFYNNEIDYFGSSAELNLFLHTWSLGVEEQFYIVFPLVFWLSGFGRGRRDGKRNLIAALASMTLISFLFYAWMSRTSAPAAYYLMPARFWELGLGCMTYLCSGHIGFYTAKFRVPAVPFLAFIVLSAALFSPAGQQFYTALAAAICTAILIGTNQSVKTLHRVLRWQPGVFLGLMSYSLYLWHWSVIVISRWTIGIHWWLAPVQLLVIFALALLSYFVVERPLRRSQWSKSKGAIIGYGVLIIAVAFVLVRILEKPLKGVLYTGAQAPLIEKGVPSLLKDKYSDGKLIWRARDCVVFSNERVGKAITAEACTVGDFESAKRRFLVVGNSFSAAEFEMYTVLPERNIGSVTVTSAWGASPVPEIPNNSPYAGANKYYWDSVVPSLLVRLRHGDFLVLVSDVAGFSPPMDQVGREHASDLLSAGLSRLTEEMAAKGIGVIFQSGNPFIREAGCDPDMAKPQWFNLADRPICKYYTKQRSLERRRDFEIQLDKLQQKHSNLYILDLFNVFCPDDVCQYYDNRGKFLYRDIWSHPSVEANYAARPIFLALVEKAIRASQMN
jgi:peptidoglycan/LPS O-acetylase OafA/YrhL